jgi:hypothetical protein
VKVSLKDAVSWAESELSHGFAYFASWSRVLALVEQGLRKHWPSKAAAPSLAAVIAWVESETPHVFMAQYTARMFIERGLKKHWPTL